MNIIIYYLKKILSKMIWNKFMFGFGLKLEIRSEDKTKKSF